jgi:hypothetical protein
MTSAMGFAFGLLRRAREVFYVAFGFLFLIRLDPFRAREPVRVEAGAQVGTAERPAA